MEELKKRREQKGLSKKEFAELVGVTERAIEYYENGQREPKASILKRMAKVLKCRMEDLI